METITARKYVPVYLTQGHLDTLQAAMIGLIEDHEFTRASYQMEALNELLGVLFDADDFAKGLR